MKQLFSWRLFAVGVALGTAFLLVAAAQGGSSSHSRARAHVDLRKTALGTILVDGRGRTLYLFEKDRGGVSMCNSACTKYWPPLISHGAPRAGKGVHQSLLRLAVSNNGTRQVTYRGHPVYTFVGDQRTGQTAGEGLDNFGGEWYAVAPNGRKVERSVRASGSSGSSGGYGEPGGGW
jgi:predicted lipoprotein with Yx(FWY)xxD motif